MSEMSFVHFGIKDSPTTFIQMYDGRDSLTSYYYYRFNNAGGLTKYHSYFTAYFNNPYWKEL